MHSQANIVKFIILIVSFIFTTSLFSDVTEIQSEKAKLCSGCHGLNGIGLSDEFPNLAGQKYAYLKKQLLAFKNHERRDPTMNAMAAGLSNSDIEQLAHYYSSFSIANGIKTTSKPVTKTLPKTSHSSADEFPKHVYISMKASGAMQIFPSETVWKGGPNMLYTAVTPDGKTVLTTSPSTNSLYLFDAQTGETLSIISVGKAPKGVKVSPNGKYAYVSNQGSANISVIDLKTRKLSNTISVADGPHNARFTKDGTKAYATLQGGAGLAVIDTKQSKMVKIIPIPGITGPHNLDLSSDEKTAYVRDFIHNVAVVDLNSETVVKIIPVGAGHGGIDVAPNDRWVATAAIGEDFISIINSKTFEVTNIKVGNGPHGIRFSEDSQWLYVTVTKDNMVVVLNTETMKVVKNIAVGKFPFWIAVKGNQ